MRSDIQDKQDKKDAAQAAEQQKIDNMVQEYLDKGGEVTVLEKYARSEDIEYTVGWGKKRKKTPNSDK
jgi:hypothetical protein